MDHCQIGITVSSPQTSAADQSPKNIEFKIFEIEFSHNYICLSPLSLSPHPAPLLMTREIIKQVHRDLFIGSSHFQTDQSTET